MYIGSSSLRRSPLSLSLSQSLFSVGDLLSAVGLTLESSSFRWMMLVAGGGTWAARHSGVFRGKVEALQKQTEPTLLRPNRGAFLRRLNKKNV